MSPRKGTRAPSMADIAKHAGVHKMTVSRVLNDYPHVSDELRKRVWDAASELGYKKNNLISKVMTQVARSRDVSYGTPIVFLSDEPSAEYERLNESTQAILKRAKERAELYGFSFDSMRYRDGELSHARINQILEARAVQGLIINVGYEDPVELDLNWERLVAVTSGGRLNSPRNLMQVHTDIPRYVRMVCEQLDARGYQRVGFTVNPISLEVFSGFALSSVLLYQFKLPEERKVPILFVRHEDFTRNTFLEWVEREKPDAVVGYLEVAYNWLTEAGYRIPEDIGFVFTNSLEPGSFYSGLNMDRALLAESAVDVVVQGILAGRFGLPEDPGRYLVPAKWNEGQTLRPRLH